MRYRDLVQGLAKEVGLPEKMIRKLLGALPGFLQKMADAESVRTPLGVFTMTLRKAWKVRSINRKADFDKVEAVRVVKLKSGHRLRGVSQPKARFDPSHSAPFEEGAPSVIPNSTPSSKPKL